MDRRKLIQSALGEEQADLVLKNAKVVNVFTGEILDGDIVIRDGYIAAVTERGAYQGTALETVDIGGRFAAPGLINAHCHVESSMVTPPAYCMEELRWGVTTLITDPHEIANVAGGDGVRYMLDASSEQPVNYFVQLPSCVPATPFEHAGDVFTAEKMKAFTDEPRVLGLGEMMNYPGVVGCDEEVMAKLELYSGRVIDGHAPSITGNGLQAYAAAGIMTDHEATTYEEAREKLRAGIAVLVREGSASKNLHDILSGVIADGLETANMGFCTDDKHLADIRREGTIRYNVKCAVEMGMRPATAIQMATINAARIYRLRDVGALAAGYKADIVVFEDLSGFDVYEVYKDGKAYRQNANSVSCTGLSDEKMRHSVNIAALKPDTFTLPQRAQYAVINILKGQIVTEKSYIKADEADALISSGALCKIAVIERHHATGNVGVGLISGYGVRGGAVATTVAHDSHNLIVVGDNDADMFAAVQEIVRVQGGYTIVRGGTVVDTMPLPVCGLMTDEDPEKMTAHLDRMIDRAHEMGVAQGIDPFITLSFMALPVIPEIRITDMGVFDVTKFEFVE